MERSNWNLGSSGSGETFSTDDRPDHFRRSQVQRVREELPDFRRSTFGQEPDVFRNPSPPNYYPGDDHGSRMSIKSISRRSSRENLASPHISTGLATQQREVHEDFSAENLEESSDAMLCLIEVDNRFSNMVLTKESITQEDSSIGFAKFYGINQVRALHCWQKQIGSSNRTSVAKVKVNDVIEATDKVDRKPIKTETDEFTDIYADFRCKRFLRRRACEGQCQKIHRFPKEDGVKCISEKHGQCLQGRKCNFLHEVASDGSDSDDDHPCTSMAVGAVVEKLKRGSTAVTINNTTSDISTLPLNEKKFSPAIETCVKRPFVGCANGSDKTAKISKIHVEATSSSDNNINVSSGASPVVKIKKEPVDLGTANSTKTCANSSSSSYSSTTTMTTSTTLSQSNMVLSGVKRKAQSPDGLRVPKKERIEEPIIKTEKVPTDVSIGIVTDKVPTNVSNGVTEKVPTTLSKSHITRKSLTGVSKGLVTEKVPTSVSMGLVTIKSEPPDLELFKEETVENMDYATDNSVKTEVVNQHNHLVEEATTSTSEALIKNSLDRKIVVPPGYVLPSLERLMEMSDGVCSIILEMGSSKTDPDPTLDSYSKIREFLVQRGLPVLSEVSNPKVLVWDVHLRIFFNCIMGVDTQDYVANIERHLANESMENFFERSIRLISTAV